MPSIEGKGLIPKTERSAGFLRVRVAASDRGRGSDDGVKSEEREQAITKAVHKLLHVGAQSDPLLGMSTVPRSILRADSDAQLR